MYPHIKTNKSLTVVIEDLPYAITSEHSTYGKLVKLVSTLSVSTDNNVLLKELITPKKKLQRIISNDGLDFVLEEDNSISCMVDGVRFPLPDSLYKAIVEVHNAKGNLQPLHNFVRKLSNNPRKEVIDELYSFVSVCGLALTEEGNFLAYKNVNKDFTDCFTGKMDNSPGQVVEMKRFAVEHNPNRTCASGLHFAAWGYLANYCSGRKTVILEISPEDVVSIPSDYNNMKGRACKYKVLREVIKPEELKDVWVEPTIDTSKVYGVTIDPNKVYYIHTDPVNNADVREQLTLSGRGYFSGGMGSICVDGAISNYQPVTYVIKDQAVTHIINDTNYVGTKDYWVRIFPTGTSSCH